MCVLYVVNLPVKHKNHLKGYRLCPLNSITAIEKAYARRRISIPWKNI